MAKIKDITGQKFGKLTVLSCEGKLDGKNIYWKCQCECGNITIKNGNSLRSGNTKSCGCMKYSGFKKHNELQTKETLIQPGTKFGKLTIIEAIGYRPQYTGSQKNRMWYKCKCDCGNEIEISGNRLKENHTISCGKCLTSKEEYKIKTLLEEQNIYFNTEVILPELVKETGRRLRFDFILYNNDNSINRIIEFDGRQYKYGPDTNYWGHSTDTLKSIKEKDNLKNDFCLKHNYPLVRIPYTKLDNLTIDDLLGNKYLIKGDDES